MSDPLKQTPSCELDRDNRTYRDIHGTRQELVAEIVAQQAEIERLQTELDKAHRQHDDEVWVGMERKNDVIEECAQVAENAEDMTYSDVASAIRALKEKP